MTNKQSASTPTFVQTGEPTLKDLDRWRQVTEDEARVVYEMTLRNELSGGTPTVREFEDEWKQRTGHDYVVTTMNGTSALYSAFFGVGVGPGDEVICPTYTWLCTIAPAPFLGARPVFAESDPRTMLLDPDDFQRRITPRTKAVVVVHLWGWVADMDRICEIARRHKVAVVEDCSHCHGAAYKGRPIGTLGDVAAWSLQGSKPVSAGEGGVLATNDVDIFERAALVGQVNRVVGFDQATPRYANLQPLGTGMKFRAHPLAIGIALVQLRKLDKLNATRRAYVEAIEAGLADVPCLEPIPSAEGSDRGGFYQFPVRFVAEAAPRLTRDALIRAVTDAGVKCGPSPYGLLHELDYFAKGFDLFTEGRGPLCEGWAGHQHGDFPATERMLDELVFLPMLNDPVDGAVEFVLERIRRGVEAASA